MKNKIIFSFAFFSLLVGFSSSKNQTALAGSNEVSAPQQEYLESTKNVTSYYSDWNIEGLAKEELLNQLAVKMSEEHLYYTSYDDVKGANAFSDEDPDDETKIISFYAGEDIPNEWNAGSLWNREHVWCKSLSNGLYTSVAATGRGAGADIHQLKPAIKSINESRGNKPYADLNHQGTEKIYNNKPTGCFFNEKYFEPRDEIKGDIARILMYMYSHYSTEVKSNQARANVSNSKTDSKSGNLKIEQIIVTPESTKEASWNLLLNWSKNDPVDSFEVKRNDYCASITGLRNPFVDHPEFGEMIWNDAYQGAGALLDKNYELKDDIPLTSIHFYHSEVQMRMGEKRKLTIDYHPYYASSKYKEVIWSSSDSNVAEMQDSLLVAKNKGTTIIQAKCGDLVASCTVHVDEVEKAAIYTIQTKTSVKESGTIIAGSSATYSQTHQTKGQMTANNSTTLVLKGYTGYFITGITLNMRSNGSAGSGGLSVKVNDTEIASIPKSTPFDSSLWAGQYSTAFQDVSIQMKDQTRKILENEEVSIVIEASVNSLYINSYSIEYSNNTEELPIIVTGITLNKDEVTLKKNETVQLIASVLPANAENQSVVFFSSQPSVASVDPNGLVKALNKGETIITALSVDGGFEATCKIIVEEEIIQDNNKKGCVKSSVSFLFSISFIGLLSTLIFKKKEI